MQRFYYVTEENVVSHLIEGFLEVTCECCDGTKVFVRKPLYVTYKVNQISIWVKLT